MGWHLQVFTILTLFKIIICYTSSFSNHEKCHEQKKSPFDVVYEWKFLDFQYPSYMQRQNALLNREFVKENNLPLGIDIYKNRIFITTPRWKDGVPASIGYLPYSKAERSPAIIPYPDWDAHGDPYKPNCAKLISVYRTSIDTCGRLWLIDSGIVNATVNLKQICKPKIVAFDLNTDKQIISYELPDDQVKEDSLHANIVVDVRNQQCDDAHVYVTDVWRFGLVVYSVAKKKSWRVTNFLFSPNPQASDFNIYNLNFQWLDGVFGMSLSPENIINSKIDRILYFHPMASNKEFMVYTSLLQDESLWPTKSQEFSKYFVEVGDRGSKGQSSTSGIARNGVMFFTQVHKDDIGCWDTNKPYTRKNLAYLVDKNNYSSTEESIIQFPNDLKIDQTNEQNVWVISNRLPIYLYAQLNFSEINFRILRIDVKNAIANTICDPGCFSKNEMFSAIVNEGECF